MKITPNCRRFVLMRAEDETGVSGIGRVAEGFQASDGEVSVRWLSENSSWIIYRNIQAVQQVHWHGGKTRIQWLDPSAFTDVFELLGILKEGYTTVAERSVVQAAAELIRKVME